MGWGDTVVACYLLEEEIIFRKFDTVFHGFMYFLMYMYMPDVRGSQTFAA